MGVNKDKTIVATDTGTASPDILPAQSEQTDFLVTFGKKVVGVPEDFQDTFRMPSRFAAINQLVLRDLNNLKSSPVFAQYTKSQISDFLSNPYVNAKSLRNAVIYLYGASAHFRRLIQYFSALTDLSYVVSPFKIDTSEAKPKTVKKNYLKVLHLLSSMDLKNQGEKIVNVCLREDVFYGTIREGANNTIIQQLPSDYCDISTIEDNVLNVSFDFSYFDTYNANLPLYPPEFRTKYELYKKNKTGLKWQNLDAPYSFAIKYNKDILNYPMPPFAGILREIYDIEDYKALKMTKTELENYAMLVMTLGVDANGDWQMDLNKAKDFYHNLDKVVPEEIGTVLSPMPINKISFERTHSGDTDTIAEAEQNLFTAAGVSSLLFNNEKASSNALLLSIKADQAMTYSIVKSIECMLNRYIHRHPYGKYFKMTFLDCSPFNRKEVGDAYLKACQYGFPMASYYCASQGLMQDEMDCMNFLEDEVLNIKERFIPLQSSSTQSGKAEHGDAGRPAAEIGDLSDEGERSREKDEN